MEILTSEEMRNIDRRSIEGLGIASLLLMESAGREIAEALMTDYADAVRHPVAVVCGKGNNGGDGLVVARHLARHGVPCRVALLARGDALRGDPAINLRACRASGVEVRETPTAAAWSDALAWLDGCSVIVDAVLGTGVQGGARGLAATVIKWINASPAAVAAVDVPSGLGASSHLVEGEAVLADRTYTLCRPKLGLVLEPAATHAGRWTVLPIGIPDSAVAEEQPRAEWLNRGVAARLLGGRAADSHKGSYGHLLAVAGSRDKSGAAVLLARGALRSGVGLMTVATAASIQPRVAAQQAEMMTEPLPETASGHLSRSAAAPALALLAERDALALGPGLGTRPGTRALVLALLARRRAPAVLDADGLNALGRLAPRGERKRLGTAHHALVLTPHPGEAARLLGRTSGKVQQDRLASARTLARRSGAIVVLKGHRSLIAAPDGRVAVNASGNPGMATGGTGDVLTGLIGALLARGLEGWDAARLGVFLHGAAGDRAAAALGQESLIASDVTDALAATILDLEHEEARRW